MLFVAALMAVGGVFLLNGLGVRNQRKWAYMLNQILVLTSSISYMISVLINVFEPKKIVTLLLQIVLAVALLLLFIMTRKSISVKDYYQRTPRAQKD